MQGSVSILNVSPEAAAMIASGGRISTMDGTAGEIYAKSLAAGQEKNEKLIGKVLSSGHTSVLEHCYVNLSFENVSVLAEQFLIEFRLARLRSNPGATSIFPRPGMFRLLSRTTHSGWYLKTRQHRCSAPMTRWRLRAFRRRTRASSCRTAFAAISSAP